jgi:hypothetical protein
MSIGVLTEGGTIRFLSALSFEVPTQELMITRCPVVTPQDKIFHSIASAGLLEKRNSKPFYSCPLDRADY